MEDDLAGLDLAVLDIDLVADEGDGDVVADAGEILVPVGDVLVGGAGGHVKHDDRSLAADVVAVAEASELLLAGGVPHVEGEGAAVGEETQFAHLHTDSGCKKKNAKKKMKKKSTLE